MVICQGQGHQCQGHQDQSHRRRSLDQLQDNATELKHLNKSDKLTCSTTRRGAKKSNKHDFVKILKDLSFI